MLCCGAVLCVVHWLYSENSWDEANVLNVLRRLGVMCQTRAYRYFAAHQPAFCRALLQVTAHTHMHLNLNLNTPLLFSALSRLSLSALSVLSVLSLFSSLSALCSLLSALSLS